MKLAISNIAWDPASFAEVLSLMQKHEVTGLEIAPGLAFPGESDPFAPSEKAVQDFKARMKERSVSLVSMQSLLFGIQGANLFGNAEERARFVAGIANAIRLGGRLGIPNLVLGSPKQRIIPEGMAQADALDIAADVLAPLGELAVEMDTVLALEPNPASYGTNFLTTTLSTLEFVRHYSLAGVAINFDIGAAIMNKETETVASQIHAIGAKYINHVHISEPLLAPAPADPTPLSRMASRICAMGYDRWFSIEMRSPGRDGLSVVEDCMRRSSEALEACYGR